MSIGSLYLTTGQTEMTLAHHVRRVVLKAHYEKYNIYYMRVVDERKSAKLTKNALSDSYTSNQDAKMKTEKHEAYLHLVNQGYPSSAAKTRTRTTQSFQTGFQP